MNKLWYINQRVTQGGAAVIPPVWTDTFTGADGTHIHDHTPDLCPAGSVYTSADVVITDNKAIPTAYTSSSFYFNPKSLNFRVTVKVTSATRIVDFWSEYIYFYFRVFSTAFSYWYIRLARSQTNSIIYTIQIHEVQQTAGDILHTNIVQAGIADNTEYLWTIENIGNQINVYWNGVLATSKADAVNSKFATEQGFGNGGNIALTKYTQFDDLNVYDIVGETPWFLADGGLASDCYNAYLLKGAVELASSYYNHANCVAEHLDLGDAPTFDTATGLTFNGSADWLTGMNHVLKPCTIIARITHDNTAAIRVLVSSGDWPAGNLDWRLLADHTQELRLNAATPITIGTSTSAVPNADTVIAVTYSASGVYTFYLDGVADGTGTSDQTIANKSRGIGRCDYGDYYFKGIMGALSVYGVVKTPAQIALLTTAMQAL